ncbi:YheT family hydrolase [Alkanindiges sp. WGS2144]|uniref:YheT family hydrolase n=1 Tax=Alkanindiges sp. WGS2144 TaxID=3366808 RepID=UPI0037536E0F
MTSFNPLFGWFSSSDIAQDAIAEQPAMPELIYKPTAENNDLIANIAQLHKPYSPLPWLNNCHLQIIALELKSKLEKPLLYDAIETLTMPDGGQTALAWYGYDLPASAPTVVILHTITGDPDSMRTMVRDIHEYTGWRVVVAVRRGHADLEFDPPRFCMFGCTQDLKHQINRIEQLFPQSPLYAIGSSAGSGLLVRYLGEEQNNARFKAAFAFCPGYNTDDGFERCHPFYSQFIAKKLIKVFIEPHQDKLQHLTTLQPLKAAKDLLEFQQRVYEFSGYDSYQDYSRATNPIAVFKQVTKPLMLLNACDDPICDIKNLEPYVADLEQLSNFIVVKTQKGSHCAFLEGWQARSWAHRLMAEYFQAIQNHEPTSMNRRHS